MSGRRIDGHLIVLALQAERSERPETPPEAAPSASTGAPPMASPAVSPPVPSPERAAMEAQLLRAIFGTSEAVTRDLVSDWIATIESGPMGARLRAATELSTHADEIDPVAVQRILALSAGVAPGPIRFALDATLVRHGDPEAAGSNSLGGALRADDANARRAACEAIAVSGVGSRQFIATLMDRLRDPDAGVRAAAAAALGSFERKATVAVSSLARLKSDADADVQQAARSALARISGSRGDRDRRGRARRP